MRSGSIDSCATSPTNFGHNVNSENSASSFQTVVFVTPAGTINASPFASDSPLIGVGNFPDDITIGLGELMQGDQVRYTGVINEASGHGA
jgi:hypothetical protein